MKQKVILALGLFAMIFFANISQTRAQDTNQNTSADGKTPEERANAQTKRLSKALGLSPEQETQVMALMLERVLKNDYARNATDKAQAFKERKELIDSQNDKFKTILTPEQFTKYTNLQEEMKNRMRDRRGGRN
ncbi:hypothetical protein SAMN04515674_10512 [Pseudarcicella hirudinis]|uniref:LTXXQ motif family protein n=1 Tax=Pseudarcicella hirudinis TaxID=1079859 RepID=A0A1I5SG80_9BACT|nr:hypothetical protein [Pseudarcicella hirudinis]SFP69721.1 hypothetical protein SAMN04515674_10512 [Pseudarcicella hirudinis]